MDSEGKNLPIRKLYQESTDIVSQIINENNLDNLDNLTKLFTINQRKKDIARIDRLSKILELVDDEVAYRVSTSPESFNNDQLVKYMNTTQQSLTSIEQGMNQTPIIQINNQKNEIHIDDSNSLNKESRDIIINKVNEILSQLKSDNNVIDITEEEDA